MPFLKGDSGPDPVNLHQAMRKETPPGTAGESPRPGFTAYIIGEILPARGIFQSHATAFPAVTRFPAPPMNKGLSFPFPPAILCVISFHHSGNSRIE